MRPFETREATDRSLPLVKALHANNDTVHWITERMDSLSRRLRSVYQDKLAEEIEEWIEPLLLGAAQMGVSFDADLDGSIRHGESMLGGLLMVGLKMAEAEDRADKAERKVKA